MLNAWHLPVAPFVKQNKDNLVITLWLAGDNQPERVTLRAEVDNEETSLKMHKVRSQPQPGVTAWRANIDLRSGLQAAVEQPPAVVYPAGFQPFPSGQAGAVCRGSPG